eukprot:TRINITY_DN277_c0_g1_i2.p1 TRINITY_DN277_c0_g1~~TRINITY_DN277_c0_g1_i2.p1  ORF type:complete len:1120 (+),score=314.50 TRINITY_DN277_c0_g1_i2:95-3361(+)
MGCCQVKAGSAAALAESRRMIEQEEQWAAKDAPDFAGRAGAVVWATWPQQQQHQLELGHSAAASAAPRRGSGALRLAIICQYHQRGGGSQSTADLVWEGEVDADPQTRRDPEAPQRRKSGDWDVDVPWSAVVPPLKGVIPAKHWHAGERAEYFDAETSEWRVCSVHRLLPGDMRCTILIDGPSRSTVSEIPLCHLRPRPEGGAPAQGGLAPSASVRLSGGIDCIIYRARGLSTTDYACCCFGKKVAGDPHCKIKDDRDRTLTQTQTVPMSASPAWGHHCRHSNGGWLSVSDTRVLRFVVMDSDPDRDDLIGQAVLCGANGLNVVTRGGTFCGWLPLKKEARKGPRGELLVWLQLRRDRLQPQSAHECPGARFRVHGGCRVALFQSAHVGDQCQAALTPVQVYSDGVAAPESAKKLPHAHPSRRFEADDDNGSAPREYQRRNAWEEQFVAMMEAREFIYVVGWSVSTDITMLRERLIEVAGGVPHGWPKEQLTVGNILKLKADQGVKVCVMIWRELTSVDAGVISFEGVAGTGSAQTQEFFENTNVRCRAFFRAGVQECYKLLVTHHQKGVCCDAPALEGQPGAAAGQRRAVGFIGGLDLAGGRWDNPDKSLFKTLGTLHGAPAGGPQGDFYSGILKDVRKHSEISGRRQDPPVPAGTPEGPRQPWQDIHCKVEGPVVRDMIENFENRWKAQGGADAAAELANVGSHPQLLSAEAEAVFPADADGRRHPESWSVQYLRSIDRYSDETVTGVEADIQHAWVQGIEKSQRFVYIENQYFMGASHGGGKPGAGWDTRGDKGDNSTNPIPAAIFNRILRAIENGNEDHWTCYVVMPLFPEGDPESSALQEIMRWQYRTIEMMYAVIGAAVDDKRQKDRFFNKGPLDYLNFFCLGNREPGVHGASDPLPADSSLRARVLRSARGQVYVHSKMLIADDEYIIVGSANINDRSMAGDRDTEHAVACWQPAYSRDSRGAPRAGAVAAFRQSLWTEHLNLQKQRDPQLPDWVHHPEEPATVKQVRQIAKKAWEAYALDSESAAHNAPPPPCHLMSYPVRLTKPGQHWQVVPDPVAVPDHPRAQIKGAPSKVVPDFITS